MSRRHFKNIDLCKRNAQMFVRCPSELKALLIRSADRSARSLAAEVTLRLLRSIEDYEFIPNIYEQYVEVNGNES